MEYKKRLGNLDGKQSLFFSHENINDDCIFLAQALKGTQVTEIDLRYNNIGCNGLKNLSQVLKDIDIVNLCLRKNNIGDEGVKYLTEALMNKQITHLDLAENKISIDGAEILNKLLLNNTKIKEIHLDIFYAEGDDVKKYISWDSFNAGKNHSITLYENKIGIKGAQYINKTFKSTGIACLEIKSSFINQEVSQNLAEAFKNIKIGELKLQKNHMTNFGHISYFIEVFKGSRIVELNMYSKKIGCENAGALAEFLNEIKVISVSLYYNFLRDAGIRRLASVLRNSDIMYLTLDKNFIQPEGALFLSQVLSHSKIVYLGLNNNCLGVNGAKNLAKGLPHSQITKIDLHGNNIENAGYQYFLNVIDKTNISKFNLHANNINPELEENQFSLSKIPRNTTPIASKLWQVFKEIVSPNPVSNEYEFIAPAKTADPIIELGHYPFLIETLTNHPNSKVHIFYMICGDIHNRYDYDLDSIDRINEFITLILNRFKTFIENKLPDLIESFGIINNNYVNLVKQFEEMRHCDIVQNLLLHRVLYYVDENQEILHPYIYKMLYKYKMPLYSKELEPNKIEKIILYYRTHQEIDGTQEIIDLLRSESDF